MLLPTGSFLMPCGWLISLLWRWWRWWLMWHRWHKLHKQRQACAHRGSVHIRTHPTSGDTIRHTSGHTQFQGIIRHQASQRHVRLVPRPVSPDDRQRIIMRFLRRCCIFTHQLNLVNEMLNFVSSSFLAWLTAKSVPNCANNC